MAIFQQTPVIPPSQLQLQWEPDAVDVSRMSGWGEVAIGATKESVRVLIHGTTTDDEVYCQFLRSELYRFRGGPDEARCAALVNNPDFDDGRQNYERRRALFCVRHPLLAQLPNPLEWHSATMQPGDLEQIAITLIDRVVSKIACGFIVDLIRISLTTGEQKLGLGRIILRG